MLSLVNGVGVSRMVSTFLLPLSYCAVKAGFSLRTGCTDSLAAFAGNQLQWLVDGHGLGAVNDPLDRRQVRILPRDRHFAGQFLCGQRLNRAPGGGVVGSNDAIDLVVISGQGIFNNAQGFSGVPFLHPLLADDFDIALVDG